MPLMSVIITTHNRASRLPTAIRSVLWQTLTDYELIVVDDASSDATPLIVQEYGREGKLRGCRVEISRGANHARNRGLAMATGELIAFLDDDDWWFPEKLERQSALLIQHDDVAVAGCWYVKGNRVRRLPGSIPSRVLLSDNVIGGFSMCMFRKAQAQLAGGLDETLRNAQDWDLWLRLADAGRIEIVPACLAYYAEAHSDRITGKRDPLSHYASYERVVKRNEDRMKPWTRLKHRWAVGYHTSSAAPRPARWLFGIGYALARWIDELHVRWTLWGRGN